MSDGWPIGSSDVEGVWFCCVSHHKTTEREQDGFGLAVAFLLLRALLGGGTRSRMFAAPVQGFNVQSGHENQTRPEKRMP